MPQMFPMNWILISFLLMTMYLYLKTFLNNNFMKKNMNNIIMKKNNFKPMW